MILHYIIIISIFLFTNIICYYYHNNNLKNLNLIDLNNRKKNLKNYNLIIFSNIFIIFLLSLLYFPFSNNFLYNYNIFQILIHTIILIISNDTWQYWHHISLHKIQYLKKNIHYMHHIIEIPQLMDYIYVHPIELITGFIGLIIPFFFMKINYISFLLIIIFRLLHEIEIHTTDNNLSYFLFFNSSNKHNKHHENKIYGNYGSMLPIWDYLMNTQI